MLRIPHFLDSPLTEGSDVVKAQTPVALYSPGTFLSLSKPQVLVLLEELGKLIKLIYLIRSNLLPSGR
jgi:hypothetical protein